MRGVQCRGAADRHGMTNGTHLIERVSALRVWDSRGRPTVEAEVELRGGAVGRAIAPAGASTGSGEAADLRDGGEPFGGYDVTRAVGGIEDVVAPALRGRDVRDQAGLDRALVELDGTADKRRLGGNALIAVSMAALHAAAGAAGRPLWRHLLEEGPARLPLPEIQIFGGGAPRRPAGGRPGLHGRRRRRVDVRGVAGLDGRGLPGSRRPDGASGAPVRRG